MQKKYMALAFSAILAAMPCNANAEGKDGTAAVVNGEKISVAEIRQAYKANPQLKGVVSFNDFYNKALDGFVSGKILYQDAVKAKVTESKEYAAQLEMAKQEIARKIYLEQLVDEKVTKAEIKKLYDDYKSTFKSEKEVKARHILVNEEKTAKNIIAKLNKGGDFNKLAKKFSKDKPDLGYFTKNIMVPEFANAAFSMKKGEISKAPVKTQFGYHVIEVQDIRQSKPLPMKQVEPQLKAMLTQSTLAKIFQDSANNSKVEKYDLDGKEIKAKAVK